jgi:hypothetical protein
MRAIQTRSRNGAEVDSFGNRSFKDLFPIPVSCHHALEEWRACVCRRDILFKLLFLIATLPKSLQCWVVSRPRNQLLHGSPRVYINHQRTLQDLKAKIRAEIANIPAAISYD